VFFRGFLLLVLVTSAGASTISGYFTVSATGGAWSAHLVSSAGYVADISGSNLVVLPESPPGCAVALRCPANYPFPDGVLASIGGTTCVMTAAAVPCVGSATGSATVDGVFYPSLVFELWELPPLVEVVGTTLSFTSSPFVVQGGGFYGLPFTMTGQIQAAVSPVDASNPTFVINDSVSGSGALQFTLMGPPPLFSLGPSAVQGTFAPEPGSVVLVACGLLLAGWKLYKVV
jgi:hypothetical protein